MNGPYGAIDRNPGAAPPSCAGRWGRPHEFRAAVATQLGPWSGLAAAQQSSPTAGYTRGPSHSHHRPSRLGLAGFDQVMAALMSTWSLPGGQLAVARDGRLVFDRGYGLAT